MTGNIPPVRRTKIVLIIYVCLLHVQYMASIMQTFFVMGLVWIELCRAWMEEQIEPSVNILKCGGSMSLILGIRVPFNVFNQYL